MLLRTLLLRTYLRDRLSHLFAGGDRRRNDPQTPEAAMPAPDLSHVILAPSAHQPGEIDRLNAILEHAGLGRPLGQPERSTPAVAVVPVSDVDPRTVADTLRQAAPEHGEDLLQATAPQEFNVDTVPREPHDHKLFASGKKTGHGTVTWTFVSHKQMPPAPPWPPDGSRPVVAVLDSGVQHHPWLPAGSSPTFWAPAPWRPPIRIEQSLFPHVGSYWGHATFLTGLIRLTAPDAQVLSLQVMKDDGMVNETNVIDALHWLADHTENGHVVDVVLMAFGRPWESTDEGTGPLKTAIDRLGSQGVKIVASAGNGATTKRTIPAFLAEGLDSPVVSVGAGNSEAVHAHYSNHGYWVHKWRCGTDVVSIMPLTLTEAERGEGYAQWSGTSFSAAIYAGELAHARAAERTVADTGP